MKEGIPSSPSLRSLSAPPQPWERVAVFRFGARLGEAPERELLLEVMGNYSNLLLADGDGTLLGAAYQARLCLVWCAVGVGVGVAWLWRLLAWERGITGGGCDGRL